MTKVFRRNFVNVEPTSALNCVITRIILCFLYLFILYFYGRFLFEFSRQLESQSNLTRWHLLMKSINSLQFNLTQVTNSIHAS